MKYTQPISLDVFAQEQRCTINAKQGDTTARALKITLTELGKPIKPEEGTVAYFRALKADNKSVMHQATINEDGTISVDLTEQVFTKPGMVDADISLYKDGDIISALSFKIFVEQAPINNEWRSDNDFSDMVEATQEALEAAQKANQAARDANDAEQATETAEGLRKTAEQGRVSAEQTRETQEGTRRSNEQTRQSQESSRVEAEKKRVEAENGRVSAEQQRVEAESGRKYAEEDRVVAEEERDAAETARKAAENDRTTAEAERDEQENQRQMDETYRQEAETGREDAEAQRQANETARGEAEETRESQEQTRQQQEQARVEAENTRAANDAKWNASEQTREDQESARQDAERLRKTAEEGRESAENERVAAEEDRDNAEQGRTTAETQRAADEATRQSQEETRQNQEADRVEAEEQRAAAEEKRQTDTQGRLDAMDAATAKLEGLTVDAETVTSIEEADAELSTEAEPEHYHIHFKVPKGDTGAAAGFGEVTATIAEGDTPGKPTVTVTQGKDNTAMTLAFEFQHLKGEPGKDGLGAGDMLAETYDPNSKQQDIFAYVDTAVQNVTIEMDEVPTESSENAAKSGGVYTALQGKQDTLTFDDAPIAESDNPVKSGGIKTVLDAKADQTAVDAALLGKQDTLVFDETPTKASANPVKSGGIYTFVNDAALLAFKAICPNNEILYDDVGKPSVMVRIPKMTYAQLGIGESTDTFPAFIVNGKEVPEIYVSKYLNVMDGDRAYSLPGRDPATQNNFDNAISWCTNKGKGWHMMTAVEWGAVALWSKANGTMPKGNNNFGKDISETTYRAIPTLLDNETNKFRTLRVATGTGPVTWSHDGTVAGVWDMNGNIWEKQAAMRLVNGEIQVLANNNGADGSHSQLATSDQWMAINGTATSSANLFVQPTGTGTTTNCVRLDYVDKKWKWITGTISSSTTTVRGCLFKDVSADTNITEYAKNMLIALCMLPADDPATDNYGQDYFNIINGNAELICNRGGGWSNGVSAGLFFSYISVARSYGRTSVGFRSAFVNLPAD